MHATGWKVWGLWFRLPTLKIQFRLSTLQRKLSTRSCLFLGLFLGLMEFAWWTRAKMTKRLELQEGVCVCVCVHAHVCVCVCYFYDACFVHTMVMQSYRAHTHVPARVCMYETLSSETAPRRECVCVHACMRACKHACVRACACVYV